MSIRNAINALLAKANPQKTQPPATVAPSTPHVPPAPPTYPGTQGTPQPPTSKPTKVAKYGDSILMTEADFAAFANKPIGYLNVEKNQLQQQLATAAAGGDMNALVRLINEAVHLGTSYAVALASERVNAGMQQDFSILQDAMSATFNTNSIDQLMSSDERYSDPTISAWAKSLVSQAREIDPTATAADIKAFVDASFQAQGLPAFAAGTKSSTSGKGGKGNNEVTETKPMTAEERFNKMFGEPEPTQTTQTTPAPTQGVPNQSTMVGAGVGGTPPAM